MEVADPTGVADWICGAEMIFESRVMATCCCKYFWVSSAQVSEPFSLSPALKAKLISIWPVWLFKPPVMGRLESISLPVSRLPCTGSVCPTSSGTSPKIYGWLVPASQATRGSAGSSEPCSGSGALLHTMRVDAASCFAASFDCRSSFSTFNCSVRCLLAAMESAAFAGALAVTFRSGTLISGSSWFSPPCFLACSSWAAFCFSTFFRSSSNFFCT